MNPQSAIADAIERSRYIRAVGPTTIDFMRWRDEVDELLLDLVGPDHPAVDAYRDAVGATESGDADGLQIEGQYGMAPRLEAAEAVLARIAGA